MLCCAVLFCVFELPRLVFVSSVGRYGVVCIVQYCVVLYFRVALCSVVCVMLCGAVLSVVPVFIRADIAITDTLVPGTTRSTRCLSTVQSHGVVNE